MAISPLEAAATVCPKGRETVTLVNFMFTLWRAAGREERDPPTGDAGQSQGQTGPRWSELICTAS